MTIFTPHSLSRIALSDWTIEVDPTGPTPLPDEATALPGERISAAVPGAIPDDLQRAWLIPDPTVDLNEHEVAWVSRTDWVYRTALPDLTERPGVSAEPNQCAGAERIDLVFDGLDTVARIELDGTEIGSSRNMHRSYRYDVTDLVRRGSRDLAVHLSSAYTEAARVRAEVGPRPNAYPEPFNFIRKMACSFGWDWGLTLPGAGIWRPARLEAWNTARIARLRPLTDVVDGNGQLRVLLDIERADSGQTAPLRVEVLLDGVQVAGSEISAEIAPETAPAGTPVAAGGSNSVELIAQVPQARRWQPVGYGTPELYGLEVCLLTSEGLLLDSTARRIGFRHMYLDRSGDDAGTRFTFRLNGEPLFVKGVNWIPDDIMPGRMTPQRYRDRLEQAVAANVNLIRVWGGGLYETDEFYEICDELGLLVWQDFPFACAAYPEDEVLRTEILAEVAENVARLAAHPSLVIWNGNNENLWLREVEHWTEQPGGDLPWGEKYYLEDLPRIVAEVDPSRPYTAGSPWSGSWEHEPNDPAHQTHHSWDVWNKVDYGRYRDSAPRFVAEFGWQAPPAWRTLTEAVSERPLTMDSPGLLHHQKAAGGMEKLGRGVGAHFPEPTSIDAWHYLTQLNQVRAMRTGIMHWRSHWPHTAGTIAWQFNDLWPVISWSAIDGAGRYKPVYHALCEIYADRALTIEPTDDGLTLCVINDSAQAWVGELRLRRVSDAGADTARRLMPVQVDPRSVTRIPIAPELAEFGEPGSEVLVADLDGNRALWYAEQPAGEGAQDGAPEGPGLPGTDLRDLESEDQEPSHTAFVGAPPRVSITSCAGGLEITVTATTLLRDFLVQPDRIHPSATADRGFITLLAGETATVMVRCPEPLTPDAADTPWALNWLDRVLAS